ncbi:hypothetical protein NX059_001750 [Plenodomus lindquistii]|nr:hypothetical protein NX059_001750 [Plenodomus lindquistii]
MSNLLDFPPSTLPYNARSPPHVIFAINGEEVIDELPPKIPLNAVLHLIPKLGDWLLPAPCTAALPKRVARIALRAPFVGIDIQSTDVTPLGLKWIMKKVVQASGLAHPRTLFLTQPSVGVAVSIYRTWTAFELPIAGVANLLTHIQTRLMIGPPVSIWEMNLIWLSFPHDSSVVREMGMNSFRARRNGEYSGADIVALSDWYKKSAERMQFHESLESHFGDAQTKQEQGHVVDEKDPAFFKKEWDIRDDRRYKRQQDAPKDEKAQMVLERNGSRKVSLRERKQRQRVDRMALESRQARARSVDSISSVDTAIWDPQEESSTTTATDQKGPGFLATLPTSSDTLNAAPDRTEPMTRGRLRSRLADIPGLSSIELAEVNEAFALKTTPTDLARGRPAGRRRTNVMNLPILPRFSARSRSRSSSASSDSTLIEESADAADGESAEHEPEQRGSYDRSRMRRSTTIRKITGREGLEEARRESRDYEVPEIAQEVVEQRESKKVVHWAEPEISEVRETDETDDIAFSDDDAVIEPDGQADGVERMSERRPGWACMVIEDE